jgi:hypothetical protein
VGGGTDRLARLRMQVLLNPLLLLSQALLSLAQVLADAMRADKGLALGLVEGPRRLEEGSLKVSLVEVEVLAVGVVCVEAERDYGQTGAKTGGACQPVLG